MEKEHEEKKTSINRINKKVKVKQISKVALKITIGIAIIVALIIFLRLSIQTPEDTTYNGFPFIKDGNLWYCNIIINKQELLMPFNYHPEEVEEIYIDPLIKNKILSLDAKDYIVLTVGEDENSLSVVATSNIARLHKLEYIRTPIHGGIYDESFNLTEYLANYNGTEKGPFVTNCGISTDSFVVVRFVSGNETTMEFSEETNNCIIATAAEPEDFRKLADRFTFELLGIIK